MTSTSSYPPVLSPLVLGLYTGATTPGLYNPGGFLNARQVLNQIAMAPAFTIYFLYSLVPTACVEVR